MCNEYKWATITAISVGTICCLTGIVVSILGFTGSIEWILESKGIKSTLGNASPGIVFLAAGVVILWRYKPRKETKIKTEEFELTEKYGKKLD